MHDWIVGVVLAGGKSRRMGCDKALLSFDGTPLIKHTTRLLQSIFSQVLIVSNHRQKYEFLRLQVVPDSVPNSGPLGGIHTALLAGDGQPVFVVGCDLPFINRQLIEYIVDFPLTEDSKSYSSKRFDATRMAKIPTQKEHLQPLCGLYFPGCFSVIEHRLNQRELKTMEALKELCLVRVPITSEQSFYKETLFDNINTPSEYGKALTEGLET